MSDTQVEDIENTLDLSDQDDGLDQEQAVIQKTVLFVSLSEEAKSDELKTLIQTLQPDVRYTLKVVSTLNEIDQLMNEGTVCSMIIFAEAMTTELRSAFEHFEIGVAPAPSLIHIACSEPSPVFLNDAFEHGVEQFISPEAEAKDWVHLIQSIETMLEDPDSIESQLVRLSAALNAADPDEIKEATERLSEHANYDFLASYGQGRAMQARGDFEQAAAAFKNSSGFNKLFRQAQSYHGESLVVLGRFDEAIQVFEKLEKLNKASAQRKAHLATAWDAKGDKVKAKEYFQAAQELEPESDRVKEAEAHLLLSDGKVSEALKKMEGLSNAGPLFAAKLNELGIRLSQAGKGKSALGLYSRAHKVVRKELRAKISLNAALACHRIEEYERGLKYITRSEKEAGGPSEKSQKIKRVLTQLYQQKSKAA